MTTRTDFEEMTVKDLKKFCKDNEIKIPSRLKKQDFISYILASLDEKEASLDRKGTLASRIENVTAVYYEGEDWLEHLEEKGWTVVPIPEWDEEFVSEFYSWLENCTPHKDVERFDRNDPNTWNSSSIVPNLHGIFKQYLGHTYFQWQIRLLCAPIYSEIWTYFLGKDVKQEDLICSFDGGCFLYSKKRSQDKQWLHIDQARSYGTGLVSVQGVVNFLENGPNDGGLLLLEGSHKVFAQYRTKYPASGYSGFDVVEVSDSLFDNTRAIKICAPPGHLLLWDSRTVHCNCTPKYKPGKIRKRMCTYVSMQPCEFATTKELEKRIKWYKEGRLTGHICFGSSLEATAPRPRYPGAKPDSEEIALVLNDLMARLIGFEIRE